MSDRAEVIVPPLVLALKEREPLHGAAVEIIMILAGFGPSAESAIPELVKILQDKTLSSPVRQRAAYSLGRIDTEGVEVVPVLSKMLRDPDRDVVIGAAGAIPSLEKALASTQDEKARGYLRKALESVQAGK
jgi:HEAT repeat protein